MPKRKASEELVLDSLDPEEPEVRMTDPMPKGYRFVPKGDVYITKHCRKKTLDAGKALYVVLDKKNKPIGLRCPAYIHKQVLDQSAATATQRAEAVQKRDAAIEEDFGEAILSLFPNIPKADVQRILKYSLKKHSGRVGRTGKVELQNRVKLAVLAHIRHVHTDYDKKLAQGVSRDDARAQVWERLNIIARQWGGRPLRPAVPAGAKAGGKSTVKKAQKRVPAAKRAKTSRAAKKVVVGTAVRTVVTRRMSVGGVNGLEEDVDGAGHVFPRDEDPSDHDSD